MKTPLLLAAAIGSLAIAVAGAAVPTSSDEAKNAPQSIQLPAPQPTAASPGEQTEPRVKDGLRMNFRGVPLEVVLNYLSDAAGFVVIQETRMEGKIDAWSNQPLNKTEAVELLNSVLNKNGYAALQSGRTLTIVTREEAKKRDLPVKVGSDPDAIPRNDQMVTQILPIHYANALQLTKDLQPLLPSFANLTANESGNALVLTATQTDIHRMAEIVKALDTSIANISTIRVFPLKFADAKDLANAVKELFTPPSSQQGGNNRNQVVNRFGGGRGGGRGAGSGGGRGGGFPGGGGPGGGGFSPDAGGGGFPGDPGTGAFPAGLGTAGGDSGGVDSSAGTGVSEARNAASRVVAIADERSNALIVSAPEEFIPSIEQLAKELDISVADVTELQVFHLRNADPIEMTDLLGQLFPDETKTGNDQNQNPLGFRFNPGGLGGNNRNSQSQATTSERSKKRGRVVAVADQRTSSIIISAASDLMPQIGEMVARLDANPARKQRVQVFSLQNADPQQTEQFLKTLFERTATSASSRNSNPNSALVARSAATQTPSAGTGMGSSGFGNPGAGNSGGGGAGGLGSGLR